MDEKSQGLLDFLGKFNPLTADYRKKEPLSIKTIKGATALTPLDSVVEISKELKKEEPDYKKIGLLTAMEAAGAVAPMAKPAMTAIKAGKKGKKVTAYKLFVKGEDGKLYPLFVDADTEVPIGKTLKATFPEYRFQAKNGNFYVPSRGPKKAKGTGDMIEIPDQETRDMLIEAGFLPKGSKAKSIRAVAARPGWHAGDTPTAKHIGPEVTLDGKKYKIRGDNQVWAEVEMPDDVDWQAIANSRAVMKKDGTPNVKTAHITDELPFGGHYRYKTNANMEGEWLISGDMKVIRELDKDEVKQINKAAGREDLPTLEELKERLGFASGGIVGENMYKGMDDYLMSEMANDGQQEVDLNATNMARGGVMGEAEQMEMNFGVPDNTIGQDPVSGNPIPIGATAENVRDDIPAQLSEGEIVVPADVVNYWGVKLFEDLRAQAKLGYNQMAEDGRIGGEPMDMVDSEPMPNVPFSIDDLEVVDGPEEAFFGGLFGGNDTRKKSSAPKRDRSMSAVVSRAQANKNKPKNRAEAIKNFFNDLFRDDDDNKPSKPVTVKKDDKPTIDFGFKGNPMERASRKYGSPSSETKNESPRRGAAAPSTTKGAGKVTQAYTGMGDGDGQTFAEKLNFPGFNEGGIAQEGQKGGFGQEISLDNMDDPNGQMEARTYQNDAGHEIIIMFVNGEPITPIPEGYYPTGDVAPVNAVSATPVSDSIVMPQQSSGGGGGGGAPMPQPQAVDYKSLSVDELTDMVQSSQSMKGDLIAGGLGIINPIIGGVVKYAMYDQARKTKEEIARRLAENDGSMSASEVETLQALLEIAEKDKPSLLQRLFGNDEEAKAKVTMGEPEEIVMGLDDDGSVQTGVGEQPEVTATELDTGKPYSPGNKADDAMTTEELTNMVKTAIDTSTDPYVGKPTTSEPYSPTFSDEIVEEAKKASREASDAVFEPSDFSPAQQIERQREDTKKAGKKARESFEAYKNDPSNSKTIARNAEAIQRTDNVIRDMERGIQRGFDEGGLVDKPKVKKVVKGLKKASKSHAKQAATLEDALKASKKKKSK